MTQFLLCISVSGASLNKDVALHESKKKWYFDRQNILIAISGTAVFLMFLAVFLAKKVNSFTDSSSGTGKYCDFSVWIVPCLYHCSVIVFIIIRYFTVEPSIGDGDDSRYNIPINSSIGYHLIPYSRHLRSLHFLLLFQMRT